MILGSCDLTAEMKNIALTRVFPDTPHTLHNENTLQKRGWKGLRNTSKLL